MPTYRSITISLISQFDILTIPEYAPPTITTDPFSNAPTLVNPDHSLVSVYIPTYPSSQFWLSYSISPPHPPKLLYYFKLYLNGNLVVSWGCGEDDDYRGKTMFGLFKPARTSGLAKGATLETRVFCFCPDSTNLSHPPLDKLNDVMEIRVFRSKARKRIKPEVGTLQSTGFSSDLHRKRSPQRQAAGSINLVNAGTLLDKHPQRYYKYALLDPLDTPFATFRYYYRSWDQLEALGVISPYASESLSITSIDSSPNRSQQNIATTAERPLSPRDSSNTLESYISVSASSDSTATNDASQMARDHKNNNTTEAPAVTNSNETSLEDPHCSKSTTEATTTRATDDDSSPQSTTTSPDASPLKIPFFLPRPPTPPPQSTSPKLHQLPNAIPPTTRDFTTTTTTTTTTPLASKESFASLIRNRLPDPDPSSFQLHNPAESPNDDARPPPPHPNTLPAIPQQHRAGSLGKRSGASRMGVLMSVVNSAKNRRRREAAGVAAGDSAASDEEEEEKGGQPSEEGERTTDGSNGGESVSIGSGSEGSAKGKAGEKRKEKKKKVKGEKRDEEGKEEKTTDKQPKKRERKLNLWEEL